MDNWQNIKCCCLLLLFLMPNNCAPWAAEWVVRKYYGTQKLQHQCLPELVARFSIVFYKAYFLNLNSLL